MPKIKIQHYVPKFYLTNFSTSKKNESYIQCFDMKAEKTIPVNIRNIGGENYFYDIDQDANQIIEKTLGKLESKFNAIYQKLIKKQNLGSLIDLEKKWIAFFVIIQLLRTRVFRDVLAAQRKQVKEFLLKEKLTPEFKKQVIELDNADSIKKMHIDLMINAPKEFVPIVMKMKWVLIINKSKKPFWTSDHPIAMYNPVDMGPWSGLGFKMQGIQIHFPLTPSLSLFLGDPVYYEHFPNRMVTQDEQNIIHENWLQVIWARRHLFSINNDYELASQILKKDPELKNPERERTKVQSLDKTFKDYYQGKESGENPFDRFRMWDEN